VRAWLPSVVLAGLIASLPAAAACSVGEAGDVQTGVSVWDLDTGETVSRSTPASPFHACLRSAPAAALEGASAYWLDPAFPADPAVVRMDLESGEVTHWPVPPSSAAAMGVADGKAYLALSPDEGVLVLDLESGEVSVREWPVPTHEAYPRVALDGSTFWVAAGAVAYALDLAGDAEDPAMWNGLQVGLAGERVRVVAMGSGHVLYARQVEPWHAGAYEHFVLDTRSGNLSRLPPTLYVGYAALAGGRLLAESQGTWFVAELEDVEASWRIQPHPGEPFEPWGAGFRAKPALVAFDGRQALAVGHVPPPEPPMESNGLRIERKDAPAAAAVACMAAIAAAAFARRRAC